MADSGTQTNGSEKWRQRVDGIFNGTQMFYSTDQPNVMFEAACEPIGTCNTDNKSFKAFMSRWMAATTKVAPYMYQRVIDRLRASATAAALQCSGGADGETCGLRWTEREKYDGSAGVGEQLSAMEVFQTLLVDKVDAPVKASTGGTSKGDPSAGTGGTVDPTLPLNPITQKDRVGAGILTALALVGAVGGVWWMIA